MQFALRLFLTLSPTTSGVEPLGTLAGVDQHAHYILLGVEILPPGDALDVLGVEFVAPRVLDAVEHKNYPMLLL